MDENDENTLSHFVLSGEEHDAMLRRIAARSCCGLIVGCENDAPNCCGNADRVLIKRIHSIIATREVSDVIVSVVMTASNQELLIHINAKLLGSGSFLVRYSEIN